MAGLMVLTAGCDQKQKAFELLQIKQIPSYPSSSGIEQYKGRIYLFGDDAPYFLVLDEMYSILDTIRISSDTATRIPKEHKADIEAATIFENHLFAISSLSDVKRNHLFEFRFDSLRSWIDHDLSPLLPAFKKLSHLNFEGLSTVGTNFILSNRANTTDTLNHLVVVPARSLIEGNLTEDSVLLIRIRLPWSESVIGVSGLWYDKATDRLYFTASEEATPSAIEDGAIGESYIGWFSDCSQWKNIDLVRPSSLMKLSALDARFKGQKIESICMGSKNDKGILLHLVADNDDGQSRIFTVRLRQDKSEK